MPTSKRHSDNDFTQATPPISASPDDRKVFGIGWAKTGTTTLGRCFEILGYDHHSQNLSLVRRMMQGDFSRMLQIARTKNSFEDWPWILLYKELDAAFPHSRFVLTVRDPEHWLNSYRAMLASQGTASEEMNEIRSYLYGIPFPDISDQDLIDRFNRHNSEVVEYFRQRPRDLLIVDWEKGDGWLQICKFLRHPIPDKPFPHLNRRS